MAGEQVRNQVRYPTSMEKTAEEAAQGSVKNEFN